jgi:isovaleryl-CoA dehydrogenase
MHLKQSKKEGEMDFNLSEEQKILRDTVYNFSQKEIAPVAEEIDKKDELPEWIFKKLSEIGVLGILIPEEYGGSGGDILSQVLVIEQLARVSPSVALSYGAHSNLCMYNLYRNGNEYQRKKYLPDLCNAIKIGALALTEPNAGSDAISITTSAKKSGRNYILNGTKTFITNAPIADVAIVYAKTDKEKGAKGITAFIVESSFKGFSKGKKIEKMGHRGSPTGELIMEDCIVPEENVLLGENRGIEVMMSGLDIERAIFSAEPVGIAQGAFDCALKYSKERIQFGKPICNFQLIQAKLADMYTQIEAARLMSYKAAILAQEMERGGKGTEIHKFAAAALLFAAEVCIKVTQEAVQIHGGYGYTLEYPVNRFLRDAKLMEIGAGTSEIRRLIIARELLK